MGVITLLVLPPELLLGVAREIEHERDLNALARTCRHLYAILNRELYRRNVQLCKSSALLWAAKYGQVATIQKLVTEGANVRRTRGVSKELSQRRQFCVASEIC